MTRTFTLPYLTFIAMSAGLSMVVTAGLEATSPPEIIWFVAGMVLATVLAMTIGRFRAWEHARENMEVSEA